MNDTDRDDERVAAALRELASDRWLYCTCPTPGCEIHCLAADGES